MNNLISVGKIITAHGLKGHVKIISYMQNPQDLFKHDLTDKLGKKINIGMLRQVSLDVFICQPAGAQSREDAESMLKIELFISSDSLTALSEDEFYIDQLKGMIVVDQNAKDIGIVVGVYNFGAGDILEIQFNNNQVEMFSFLHSIFPLIAEKITFIPPKIL